MYRLFECSLGLGAAGVLGGKAVDEEPHVCESWKKREARNSTCCPEAKKLSVDTDTLQKNIDEE